jgi:CBS domain containing-hemolysin-like protein
MTTGAILMRLAAVFALLAANGFFVAVEFALVSLRRTRIDQMAARGSTAAKLVQRMQRDPDRILAASQLGITIASLALGWVGESTVAAIIEPLFEHLPLSTAIAHTIGLIVSFTLITALHIIVGEQAPKTFAIRFPETTSLATVRPTLLFDRIFRPFVWVLDAGTAAFLRLLGVKPVGHHGTVYTLDELQQMLSESRQAGVVESVEEKLITRAFEFGAREVHEVMVPRTDVVGITVDSTIEDLLKTFSEHPHSRFPVYRENLDQIEGTVNIKEVMRHLAEHRDDVGLRVAELIRPAFYVPESKPIAELMAEMRARRAQMAVVIDEHGGTAGIVTAEEVIEEIVGRLSDELTDQTPEVETIDDQTVQVDAQMRVDEANETLSLSLPENEEYETLAGLILHQLRRIPAAGERVRLGDVQLSVAEMRGPKIEKVRIKTGRG